MNNTTAVLRKATNFFVNKMENKSGLFCKSFTDSKTKRLDLLQSGRLSDCEFLVGEDDEENEIKIKTEDNKDIAPMDKSISSNKSKAKLFRCHKMILAISSEVFERMFYGEFDEVKLTRIIDISPEVFEIFINYIYTYDINSDKVSLENIDQLLYVAEKYMVTDFAEKCIDIIKTINYWNVKDILPTFELSCLYENLKLMLLTYKKICANAMAVLQHESFFKLNVNNLKRLMVVLTQSNKVPATTLLEYLKKYGRANKIFQRPFNNNYNTLMDAAYCLKLDKHKCKAAFFLEVPDNCLEYGKTF